MMLGAYPRRRSELLAPFTSDGQFRGLTVEHCELSDLPDAAWAEYERDANKDLLVTRHARFFRSIFVPSLASAIADEGKRSNFADRLEEKLKQRLATHPVPLHSFVQTLVLAKQGLPIQRPRSRNELGMADTSSQTSSVRLKSRGVPILHQHAFFYGRWVVAASAVGLFWGPPVTVYSFSVFLKPLMKEFHTGRAPVSLGYTLHLIAGAVCAPLVGWLDDHYDSRRVIFSATAMFGSILLLNKILSANIWQFYLFYVVLGLLINGVGPILPQPCCRD